MANTKEYYIKINGLTESVSAVESLNKQLDALEKRIKAIDASSVKVSTGGGGGNASALNEEAAVQKEINKLKAEGEKLDAKIVAAQDEVYKKVDATKQLYKETIADQKALAAQERLTADAYSNTMQGMKNHLADLKAAINVTDLGDSDKIKKMTQEANELTNKLKQMEEAYGTFGRNVGNYPGGEGFKGLAIQVGDVTKEFDNAKQALKELKKERDTLSTKKDMGLISEEEAKRLQDLIPVVAKLQSSIQDAGKPMDELMDTMQSMVALMQSAKGLSAFFGLDDSKVEESIQKLVALQNVMQGLQTIQKQLQTQEGIGKWLSKGNAAIDAFTKKLFGLDKATKTTNTALASTGTAGKAASTGLGTASVAANTATKSFSLATAAATALKIALAALGIGLVIAAISALAEGIGRLIDKQKEAKKYQEDLNNAVKDGQKEYAKASLEMSALEKRLKSFNGTKQQEKQLVDELNSKYGTSIGQYKSVKEWQEAIVKKAAAYAQALRTEAEAQAYLNMYTQQFIELEEAKQKQEQKDSSWVGWLEKAVDTVAKGVTKINKQWGALATSMSAGMHLMFDDNIEQMQANLDNTRELYDKKVAELIKIQEENELGNYAPQIEKNGKKTKDAIKKLQNEINQLELKMMEEGLNKKLKQLDEEERQTINKLQENGRKSSEEIKKIQRAYATLRAKEIQNYLKNIEENLKQSSKNIEKIQFDIDTKEIENKIEVLDNNIELWKTTLEDFQFSAMTSNSDLKELYKKEGKDYKENVNQLRDVFKTQYEITRNFIDNTIATEISFMKDEKSLNEERIKAKIEQEKQAEKDRYNIQFEGLEKERDNLDKEIKLYEKRKDKDEETLEEMKANRDKYDKQIQQALSQHTKRLTQITEEGNNAIKKNENDTLKDISATQERYFSKQISNYRDLVSKINSELDKSPIANKNTGIVDKEATRKQYLELINAAEFALNTIEQDKIDLDKKFSEGLITQEAKHATEKTLDELKQTIEEGYNEILDRNVNVTGDYLKSLEMYLQAAAEIISTIMGGIFDAINNGFDREQEELDREYEQMQDELDKRRDAIKDYTSEINSIEDELATARGSRRQHLIDQLNDEMQLQREAAKEKERLDKEEQKNKEQMQKKQDALDKKRRKAEWYQNLAQAVVNGAMAVTYAAMNKWPIPAIPLMQLAAATSAAQLAVIAANHPFEKGGQLDGGVAQGPRHRDGGIPVLGGRASIEGGEFITNRITTQKNIEILEFVNSQHKKLDLSDFIDFYGGKVRKSITASSPRTKFADGGTLPTLSNIDVNDRLLDAFTTYADKPIWVSVQDINSRQAAVRNVQVLAGLKE